MKGKTILLLFAVLATMTIAAQNNPHESQRVLIPNDISDTGPDTNLPTIAITTVALDLPLVRDINKEEFEILIKEISESLNETMPLIIKIIWRMVIFCLQRL